MRQLSNNKQKAKLFAALLSVIILICLATRIIYVNLTAERIDFCVKNTNEWLSLDDSFMVDNTEMTSGYFVKVNTTSFFTNDEYIEYYNIDKSDIRKDEKDCIIEIDLTIKNENNDSGKLMVIEWTLLNKYYDFNQSVDMGLLQYSEPKLKNASIASVTIKPNTQYNIKLPFRLIDMDPRKVMENAPFYFVVTKYPVRNMVRLAVQ